MISESDQELDLVEVFLAMVVLSYPAVIFDADEDVTFDEVVVIFDADDEVETSAL